MRPEVTMRIDKFLKNARIIKRRTVAKEACEQDRVLINDKPAKPGTEVKEGDIIKVRFGNREISAKVISILEHPSKEDALKMCEYLE